MTGGTHEAETEGLRDDGTWFSARVRTHPLQGLGDVPTGFIEVVEDITEEKRAEKLGRIEADLREALMPVQNVRKALTLAFEAALRVESIDGGCVFLLGWEVGRARPGRGPRPIGGDPAAPGAARAPIPSARISWRASPDAPRSVAAIPILHRGEVGGDHDRGQLDLPGHPAHAAGRTAQPGGHGGGRYRPHLGGAVAG